MDLTCGIYLYHTIYDKVLIGSITGHNGMWSIPKGGMEEGETYFDAAKRELFEETNIDLDTISILNNHELNNVLYRTNKKILKSFLIVTDEPIHKLNLKCNSTFIENDIEKPEFDGFKWVNLDEIKFYVHESQNGPLDEIRSYIY
jgi:8-oxo-dGTP pyrophosphatase MutT (NUDIX family)